MLSRVRSTGLRRLLRFVILFLLAVHQAPAPVGALHHPPVQRHPPLGRHPVVVPQRVVRLVHQRHVTRHGELEPSARASRARHAVQVHLEVVAGPLAPGAPQVRRLPRVDRELLADVVVEHDGGVLGHDVAGVADAEKPQPRDGVEPLPEAGAADARAGERERGHGAGGRRRRRHVVAVGGDVERVERGERLAEAVARHGDAELLVLVRIHQPPHLAQRLVPRAVLVVAGRGVGGGVHGQPAAVHHGVAGAVAVPEAAFRRHHGELEVVGPLQRLHGAAPRDDDVAAPERGFPLVGGRRDVADPVGLPAPPARPGHGPEHEGGRHGYRRRGVQEPGDPVRGGVRRQPRPGEAGEPRVRRRPNFLYFSPFLEKNSRLDLKKF
jgi:hypothetical protein